MARVQKKSVRFVQGSIKYQLSDAGRRDSLLGGGDGLREQSLTGPIDEFTLQSFAIADDGSVSYDLSADIYHLADDEIQLPECCHVLSDFDTFVYWDKVPTWDQLIGVIQEISRVAALDKSLKEAAAVEFVSSAQARATFVGKSFANIGGHHFPSESDVYREAVRRRDADLAALKQRNRATLTKWIQSYGTDNQRERLVAGLLPWKEAHDAIDLSFFGDHYFSYTSIPFYERFVTGEVCVCPDTGKPVCEPKYQAIDATELSATEWQQLSIIKKVFGEAAERAGASSEYQYREHSAKCMTAQEPTIRRGVIVKITLDELTFKREFALTGVTDDNSHV